MIPELPGCGRPATVRIELYSARDGMVHGSLDGAAHACDEHLAAFVNAIRAAGFTPFTMPGSVHAAGTRCGSGSDYTGPRMVVIQAPTAAPASVVDVLLAGAIPSDVPAAEPVWCVRDSLCTKDGVHTSKPVSVAPGEGDTTGLRIWLESFVEPAGPPVVIVEFTRDGHPDSLDMPLAQAQLLARHLTSVVAVGGGA